MAENVSEQCSFYCILRGQLVACIAERCLMFSGQLGSAPAHHKLIRAPQLRAFPARAISCRACSSKPVFVIKKNLVLP
ncbi:MAG: hypothetical protein ACRCS9_16320, partial [Hyphomicrobium sp.]